MTLVLQRVIAGDGRCAITDDPWWALTTCSSLSHTPNITCPMREVPTDFEQPQATPVIPHIIENYREWPSNLSAFTEPLFKSIQNPATDPGSSLGRE
jgi:hypothetical protein